MPKIDGSSEVAPVSTSLPAGYQGSSFKVLTNPYDGTEKGLVIYSDGVDDLIVQVSADANSSIGSGHLLARYRDRAGISQYSFIDQNVQFVIAGRSDLTAVQLAETLYQQVAQ